MTNCSVAYTLSILLGGDGSEELHVPECIHYGSLETAPDDARLIIVSSGSISLGKLSTEIEEPGIPLEEVEGVPLLFGNARIEEGHVGRLIVYADIIASAYFLLTRYEEIVRRDVRDKHGRFPGSESIAFRAGFLQRPVVDEYGRLLRTWLRKLGIKCPEPDREFSVVLTHDVDVPFLFDRFKNTVRPTLRALLKDIKRSHVPVAAWLGLCQDPLDTFDWIKEQDSALQRVMGKENVSSLYFMLTGEGSSEDAGYDLQSSRIVRLMQRLQEDGGRLGLHASYSAGREPDRIVKEAALLKDASGGSVTANRHHYLRCCEPEDILELERAGITDDYTMGYADQAGFRLGVCRPVRLFDAVSQRLTSVTAHPLTMMDCSLSRREYMGLSYEEALELCGKLAARVQEHKGELVLLWHNTEFRSDNDGYHRKLYQKYLENIAVSK